MSQPAPPPGMPILSGPPPLVESSACRQCGRDFNPLWRRSKACGHCGYEYCTSCLSDGHALMPRRAGAHRSSGGAFSEIRDAFLGQQGHGTPGYDVEPVCGHCLGMLQVTAAPLATLRTLPLKRLKEYLKAYDIKVVGVKEKEELVQAVIRARSSDTGCLMPEHESFYRRKSVPREGHLPGQEPPPPQQTPPYQPRQRPPRATSNTYARPPPPHYAYARPPPPQARPPPPQYARPPPPRPQPQPQAAPRPPPVRTPTPPVPTILSLVALPKSYLNSLSIGTLKAILYDNHVRVDFKQVLEKNEVIDRVHELVEDERKRLERQRKAEEREAAEAAEAEAKRAAAAAREAAGEEDVPMENGDAVPSDPSSSASASSPEHSATPPRPGPTGPAPEMDRGLCVVCQDEEATLAVVDCGHLAMCQHCSDLIMATSKECPLCRTRIVTAQRLIRIYRV